MSYEITIKVNAGTLAVSGTGDLPDGEFTVQGHADNSRVTLTAEQRDETGRYVIRAVHHHAPYEIEQAAARPPRKAAWTPPAAEVPANP